MSGVTTVHVSESKFPEDPQTFEEAMNSADKDSWLEAMNEEWMNMQDLHVFDFVDLPPDAESISNPWIFKRKYSSDGKTIERFRAKVVLRGFAQREGIDYHELYAPTCRFEVIRCILSVAVREFLVLWQADARAAFLVAPLDTQIYMDQIRGFEDKTNRKCLLKQALYVAKQSPRCFYIKFREIIESIGLKVSTADPCVFLGDSKSRRIIVCMYVDDLMCAAATEQLRSEFLNQLKKRLEITIRPLQNYLGIEIG